MLHNLGRCLMLAIVSLCLVASMAMAADMKMSGMVWSTDSESLTLAMKMADGRIRVFTASGGLMSELNPGDQVEVVADPRFWTAKSVRVMPLAQ